MSDRVRARRFVVDLGDVQLSDAVARRIGDGIQRVVLAELADQREDRGKAYGIRFPVDWIGLIIRERLAGLDELEGIEKELGGQIAGLGR